MKCTPEQVSKIIVEMCDKTFRGARAHYSQIKMDIHEDTRTARLCANASQIWRARNKKFKK